MAVGVVGDPRALAHVEQHLALRVGADRRARDAEAEVPLLELEQQRHLRRRLGGHERDQGAGTVSGRRCQEHAEEDESHGGHPTHPPHFMGMPQRHFLKFTFIKIDPSWRRRDPADRARDKQEFAAAVDEFGEDHFVRAYSLVGTRGDTDLMIRCAAPSLDPVPGLPVLLNESGLMRYADISHSYLAMTKESVYSD